MGQVMHQKMLGLKILRLPVLWWSEGSALVPAMQDVVERAGANVKDAPWQRRGRCRLAVDGVALVAVPTEPRVAGALKLARHPVEGAPTVG